MITKSVKDIGLVLNPTKCEIICFDDKSVNMKAFKDHIRVRPEDRTLLGAPILKGPAIDKALSIKIDDLTRSVSRLTQLQTHDDLTLLRNWFSMPKLHYILRTSPCNGNNLLEKCWLVFREGLTEIFDRLRWRTMVTSQSTGECRCLGDQDCSEAGTFSLFGLCRNNTVAPEPHPEPQAFQTLMHVMSFMDHLFRCTRTTEWSLAHTESLGSSSHQQSISWDFTSNFLGGW